ncbi:hypothetical protein C8R45DRAFT_1040710 [Mycena sanguinolenta]|nr:hypothetical protein C8R45DRAFT_1040710 [Mycena sanguinolenta]
MVVPATIDNTLGALYITVIITSLLFGVGIIQSWVYFQYKRKDDHWGQVLLVACITVLDIAQQSLICHAVYGYAVTGHGDPTAMLKMQKTIIIELFFGGAIALSVQQFYCWRIWKLSNSWIIGILVALPSFAYFVFTYVYTALTMNFASLSQLITVENLATALNILGAVSDSVITLAMIFCLHTNKTEYKRTTDLINRLIFLACSTGIPTTLCSIVDVICLNTMPQTWVYMCFFLIMDRLYTNCLLVTLNSRDYIRNQTDWGDSTSTDLTASIPRIAHPGSLCSAHDGAQFVLDTMPGIKARKEADGIKFV